MPAAEPMGMAEPCEEPPAPWDCAFPVAHIDEAPLEGVLSLPAVHHGGCSDCWWEGDMCEEVGVTVTVRDPDGVVVSGNTTYEGSNKLSGGVSSYGRIVWRAANGPLEPGTTYDAKVDFETCGSCYRVDADCSEGGDENQMLYETGESGPFETTFTTVSDPASKLDPPQIQFHDPQGIYYKDFQCYAPILTVSAAAPSPTWLQEYLRYELFVMVNQTCHHELASGATDTGPCAPEPPLYSTESELLFAQWGGSDSSSAPLSISWGWDRAWRLFPDDYCVRLVVTNIIDDTSVEATRCQDLSLLGGSPANGGLWTTVPSEGPFCDSASRRTHPDVRDVEVNVEVNVPEHRSDGCGAGPSGSWLLTALGAALLAARLGRRRPPLNT